MARQRMSRQELNRRRRASGFIGRTSELNAFRDNLARDPRDAAFQYLFHVHGNAGVGKTSLVRQWEAAAKDRRAVTAYVDDNVHSVIEAMEAVSAQLEQQGVPMRGFQALLAAYRQRRHEVETSPGFLGPDTAPGSGEPASASPSSTVIAQAGLAGLGLLPGVGAIAGAMDPQALAQSTDRLRAMVGARFRSHDDVRLVVSPLQVLTPAFLADLDKAAERRPWIALFFDVFERTGPLLNDWLRDVLVGDVYGTLPDNVVAALSGQGRLDTRCWGDHQYLVCEVALEVFTENEARDLLAAHGVTDEQIVQVILELTGRLPVLVDLLAQTRPSDPGAIGDPSGTAVDRFLRWITDTDRRGAALACALPLQLNEDIYRAAVPTTAADQYPWLRGLPFVTGHGGGCRYHDIVRAPMLRLQRAQSPGRWQEQHTRLAETFRRWREGRESGRTPYAYGTDPGWQDHRINETFHRLCADPARALPSALHDIVRACAYGTAFLRRWAQALAQAGHDTDTAALVAFGTRLHEAADDDTSGIVTALTHLLATTELPAPARALAHTLRGQEHRIAERYDQAVTDCTTALALAPDLTRAHYELGVTHLLAQRYDEALASSDRAVELEPTHGGCLAIRAETYRVMKRYEEALTDFNRAIQLRPDYTWAIASRGETYRLMRRYGEALTDLNRAIQLNPDYVWAIVDRGETYHALQRYDEALVDLHRALELSPGGPWYHCDIATVLHAVGDPEEHEHWQAAAEIFTEQACSEGPTGVQALGDLMFVHCATGELGKATAVLEEFLSRGPTVWRVREALTDLADVERDMDVDPVLLAPLRQRLREVEAALRADPPP